MGAAESTDPAPTRWTFQVLSLSGVLQFRAFTFCVYVLWSASGPRGDLHCLLPLFVPRDPDPGEDSCVLVIFFGLWRSCFV